MKKATKRFGNETFSFKTISKKDVLDLIKQLSGNKATSQSQYSRNLFLPIMKN